MEEKRFHSLLGELERAVHYDVGRNSIEKCEAALTKLLVPTFDSQGVAPFKSLKDAYIALTGDLDIGGLFYPQKAAVGLRSCQDFNSGTFSYALTNAMNVALSKMYKEFPYHEEILISEKKKTTDFRKINSVQLGYFGALPDVDPETGDYTDIPSIADTESQYDIGQKGAVVWFTRRHVINDSVGVVQNVVKRMARAARLAHAKYVWNFYISNGLCPDGTAWFTLGHGNLGATALGIPDLVVAITALANMTEPGPSSEKLGMDFATFNWHLIVPIPLWGTAVKTNQADSYYTANDMTAKVPNPCQKLFGEKNERIVVCPFLTDDNDWGMIRDREDVPIVEMSYMNGHEEPEFILEKGPNPLSNYMFVSDRLGYKIRHEYGGTLGDYLGGHKSILA